VSRGLFTGIAEVRNAPGGGLKSLAACVASAAVVAALLAFPIASSAAQGERTAEYRSKANFLTAFPSFVDWPGTAFASAQAPFLICVRGDFSFGTALAEAARGATPHGRRIEVRWAHKEQELLGCQVLFVSRSESKNYAKLLRLVEGRGVLTIGETADFLAAGGMISFALDRDTLQFEVNLVAADSERLKISSRLLALARRVLSRTEAAKN
jgi:YfiR/HmsC-like